MSELDLFRRFFDDAFFGSGVGAPNERHWSPASSAEESENHYLLSVDMPGVPRNEIKIEFQNDILSVTGERKEYGKFQRTFRLPTDIDAGKIEAAYEDGVLRIAVPKAEAAKPRQISLTEDKSNNFFTKWLGNEKKEEKDVRAA